MHDGLMDLKWLAKQLERPGYSQSGLAQALGKSQSAVSRILSGQRQLKASEVPIILKYLGEVIAPPSPVDVVAHNAALGRAFSEWNEIEIEMSALLSNAFDLKTEREFRLLFALFDTPRTYTLRLEMLDNVLSAFLKHRRNELDAWRALLGRIKAAGERRDQYARSVTTATAGGRVLGYAPDRTRRDISTEQLYEDAQLFQTVVLEMRAFDGRLRAIAK